MPRHPSIFERRGALTRCIALAVLPAILLLSACSKSQSAACTDAQNLKDSLTALTQMSPSSITLATLQTDVNNVKTAADALKSEAQSTFGTDVTAIETQLATLERRGHGRQGRSDHHQPDSDRGSCAQCAEDGTIRPADDGTDQNCNLK